MPIAENQILAKINLFQKAAQMAALDSPEQHDISFKCPAYGSNAIAYMEDSHIYAFCTCCGICHIS
ncbi:hypothetical protein [Ethanoligenens harbinense]|uniref:Uncharacterized protein n=1 Tax=Ethanoligenens harbinense (strain DSM 18485 / JCM 12961 / CGMCC 1.5033 / YUAN-3) TaxID=663278 RepID=E6U3F9_ETHHY|nr:hypothetical protein [Ethanoligenens harbinense]ADU26451.1 hypothetical protein Ethha_0890 [Ethanoligenens harbinense YUAN-3]AVQ95579.1 hypothetical protein CXQ68_04615 [Ethanoligenens harbinense YUAN-3]AYF38243.1 hypothetical protein CXP51_04475 [Ethanoligenens harbinense]AYF40989.1 hypothetical protein CN246_04610 [Ethanoligenens harbinense]QCN91819.1 hypothetical protein DRA42_04625 [Ethanoligenens harbinense]